MSDGEVECPKSDCSFTSLTRNGVVMHYLNKTDHTEYTKKAEVYGALDSETSDGESTPDVTHGPGGLQDSHTDPSVDDSSPSGGAGTTLDLPPVEDDTGGGTDNAGDVCPECGSGKYSPVGEESEKLRSRGIDPGPLPDDARICYECWCNAESRRDVTVYKP